MIFSGWLRAFATDGQTSRAEWLVEVPGLNVLAMSTLTGLSAGVFRGTPGSAATSVTEYGQVGNPNPIDIPDQPENNAFYIDQCRFIRFRLTVFQSNAYGHASAFPTAPASFAMIKHSTKTLAMRRAQSGTLLGSYRISRLSVGSELDESLHISRLQKSLGAAEGLSPSDIVFEEVKDEAAFFQRQDTRSFTRQWLNEESAKSE